MMTTQQAVSVPPHQLEMALAHVRNGGRLCVRTYARVTVIDRKCLDRFEQAGHWLIKVGSDGNYRLRQGKGSICLLPGQLEMIE